MKRQYSDKVGRNDFNGNLLSNEERVAEGVGLASTCGTEVILVQ